MRELADLWRTSALLSWDQQTMMPPRGAEGRARATATLRVISHQKLVDPVLGELLDEAAADSLDPPRAAMVRVLRRERDQSVRLPDDLVRRLALAASRGQAVWQAARRDDDWESFRPCIEETVQLKREEADLLGHEGERYDALLDAVRAGDEDRARSRACSRPWRRSSCELIGAIAAAPPLPDPPFAGRRFADPLQWDLTIRMLADIGFDLDAGRQDRSAHPFTTDDRPARRPVDHPDRRGRPVLGAARRRSTRPATGCTSRGSIPSTRTRRSRRRRRSGCTSRSRASGRTSSAAVRRSGSRYYARHARGLRRRHAAGDRPRTSTARSTGSPRR